MKKIYSNIDLELYEEDARDYLESTEEEATEQAVYDLAQRDAQLDWEDFVSPVLERYFDSHPCIIDGRVGSWCGRYEGGTVTESSRDFFNLLEDCYYVEIFEDKGKLIVEGIHHDGRNYFEVRELTDKGYSWYRDNSWYWAGTDAKNYLFNYNFNSRTPKIDWCL